MQFEELLKLVREVGKAGLTEFEYIEGNLTIKMSAAKNVPAEGKENMESQTGRQDSYTVETNIPVRHDEDIKKEVMEAPVEGIFYFSRLDGTACSLKPGDFIRTGQVLGRMDSRGRSFELMSDYDGEVVNIYVDDGEEIVAREPLLMIAVR